MRRGRNGGYFVRSAWGAALAGHVQRQIVANWEAFEQIFDARTLIEPLIARTVALRRTEGDMVPIRAALSDYLGAADHDASRRADSALHLAIAQATHNTFLVQTSMDLRRRTASTSGQSLILTRCAASPSVNIRTLSRPLKTGAPTRLPRLLRCISPCPKP